MVWAQGTCYVASSHPSCGNLDVFNLVQLPGSWLPLKILVLSVIYYFIYFFVYEQYSLPEY